MTLNIGPNDCALVLKYNGTLDIYLRENKPKTMEQNEVLVLAIGTLMNNKQWVDNSLALYVDILKKEAQTNKQIGSV